MNLTARDLRILRAEVARLDEQAGRLARIRDVLFQQQLAFIDDPSRLKAALCSRRAGKSVADAAYLFQVAEQNPGTLCLFVCITRDRAKSIMWDGSAGLKVVGEMAKLGLDERNYNETDLTCWLPNGSRIRLFGADSSKQQLEKVLGDNFALVIIDECASFRSDLRRLVKSRIKPAAIDRQATIALTGTPGDFIGPKDERHMFYAVTNGEEPGWSVHKWNTLDNPHMRAKWEAELEEIERVDPLYKETADFKIMYLGEWAVDLTKIVYKFGERNLIERAPANLTSFGIGIDLGWEDATAFTVGGWNKHDPTLYLLRSFKQSKMTLDDVGETVRGLQAAYPNARLIIDGAAKQAVETIKRRYQLPLHAADKQGKPDFINTMNTDLVTARIKLVEADTKPLVEEWRALIWDEDARIPTELASCANHAADSALYLWRDARNYLAVPEKPPVDRNGEEAFDAQILKAARPVRRRNGTFL